MTNGEKSDYLKSNKGKWCNDYLSKDLHNEPLHAYIKGSLLGLSYMVLKNNINKYRN